MKKSQIGSIVIAMVFGTCATAIAHNCCQIVYGTITGVGTSVPCGPGSSQVCETGTVSPITPVPGMPEHQEYQVVETCTIITFTPGRVWSAPCDRPLKPGQEKMPGTLPGGVCCFYNSGTVTVTVVQQATFRIECAYQCATEVP